MITGHQIVNAERKLLDGRRATRWRLPRLGPFDDVRAKIVTDLAGLLILLSLAAWLVLSIG